MKIYINNRDLITWPSKMAKILSEQGHEVIFIDNASTWQPLLDFYNKGDYKVIKLDKNYGHKAPWKCNLVDFSDYYVVTDSDLDIEGIPKDWDKMLIQGILRHHKCKCGFSLDETDIPSNSPIFYQIEMEKYKGFHPYRWGIEVKLDDMYFKVAIDTTFAVYKKGFKHYYNSGVRIDKPYCAKHMPWYIVDKIDKNIRGRQIELNEELYYYYKNCDIEVSNMAKHLKDIIRNYEVRNVY